eukprot:TRINITY_DN45803_c0_g1_i1.p3 TRINITY_DN45803_c0_g1~~TRINITY_DN45803_c0_g1_i1.p3  ORF type:complete len:106 (+),score=18.57 TRINITY_DN45803_c0_g1_i1:72-389(+)
MGANGSLVQRRLERVVAAPTSSDSGKPPFNPLAAGGYTDPPPQVVAFLQARSGRPTAGRRLPAATPAAGRAPPPAQGLATAPAGAAPALPGRVLVLRPVPPPATN